jgi:hypothetical protein
MRDPYSSRPIPGKHKVDEFCLSQLIIKSAERVDDETGAFWVE